MAALRMKSFWPTNSIFVTSAPNEPSTIPATGPCTYLVISTTRIPRKGPPVDASTTLSSPC